MQATAIFDRFHCRHMYLTIVLLSVECCLEWRWQRWKWGCGIWRWGCSRSSSADSCTVWVVWRPVYFQHRQVNAFYILPVLNFKICGSNFKALLQYWYR